jgi:hypothetical protein
LSGLYKRELNKKNATRKPREKDEKTTPVQRASQSKS